MEDYLEAVDVSNSMYFFIFIGLGWRKWMLN